MMTLLKEEYETARATRLETFSLNNTFLLCCSIRKTRLNRQTHTHSVLSTGLLDNFPLGLAILLVD